MSQVRAGRQLAGALCGLAALLAAGPGGAGVRYSAVTEDSGGDRGVVAVEAEGAAIRIEFRDRGEARFGKGDYLISADGGETVYWVEPKKRRYTEVDFERISQMMGRLLQGIPGVFSVKIEEPRVEKLLDEEAPPLLGFPTRHLRYLMTYRERTRVTLPAKRGVESTREETWHQVVQDVWTTGAVSARSHDFWLRERFRSGYEDLDRVLGAEWSLAEGFPLRVESVKVSATRDLEHTRVRLSRDGSSVTHEFYLGDGWSRREIEFSRTATEVTAFETTSEPIARERFEPPAGFEERKPKGY